MSAFISITISSCRFFYYFVLAHLSRKVFVSFSDWNLSVVSRRRCFHCNCWRKLFTFSSSSPEPVSHFNQAWHIASCEKEIEVCGNEGRHPFQGNIIMIHWRNFNQTWHKAFLVKGIQFPLYEGQYPFPKGG